MYFVKQLDWCNGSSDVHRNNRLKYVAGPQLDEVLMKQSVDREVEDNFSALTILNQSVNRGLTLVTVRIGGQCSSALD